MLGLPDDEKNAIQIALHHKEKLTDFPIKLATLKNGIVDAKCCGLSVFDPQRNFSGALLVLRYESSQMDNDAQLTEYHLSVIRNVKRKSGSTEDRQTLSFLRSFYQPYFNHIEDMVYKHGGSQQGLIYTDVVNQWALENDWDFRLKDQTLTVGEKYTPAELLKGLSAMLAFTRAHIESMEDPAEVEKELNEMTRKFERRVNETFAYIETELIKML
jgi:hypothetical protein